MSSLSVPQRQFSRAACLENCRNRRRHRTTPAHDVGRGVDSGLRWPVCHVGRRREAGAHMKRRTLLVGGGAAVLAGGALAGSFEMTGSAADYARAMETLRAPLGGGPDLDGVIRYATLAANGHNTQPWRFHASGQTIRISPDLSRRTPAVDPDDHHLYASLGCAAENLALAAAARGLSGNPRFDPASNTVVFDYRTGAGQPSPLCDAIPKRQSTRRFRWPLGLNNRSLSARTRRAGPRCLARFVRGSRKHRSRARPHHRRQHGADGGQDFPRRAQIVDPFQPERCASTWRRPVQRLERQSRSARLACRPDV